MKYRHSLKERRYCFLGVNQNSSGGDKEKGNMEFWNIEEPSNSRVEGFLRRQFVYCLFSIKVFI